jgi:soluble lytic murein transglycosylase-like protein
VLPSLQAVEGGRVGMVRIDANGSADLGVMQVNTVWVEPLAKFARMAPAAVYDRLISDPCFNIAAAAAILRVALNESGGNLLTGVARYHSHSPALGQAYLAKVLHAAESLFVHPH